MAIATYKQRLPASALKAALCLVALAAPAAARADRIDRELIRGTRKLLERIKTVDGVKNGDAKSVTVGVLKFRSSRDDGPEDFHFGPINNVMADRLENTLILGYNTDPECTLNVIHDATTAAAHNGLSYQPAETAGRLFDVKYPLVVTGQQVTPDIFLTGLVHFDTKEHQITVVIQSLTKTDPQLREVLRFTVPTERSTVAESGRSFVIQRALAERDAGPQKDEAKDEAGAAAEKSAEEARLPAPKEATPGIKPVSTPDAWVDLDVLYNDEPVVLERDVKEPGNRAFARDPKKDDRVKLILTNKSQNRVAVALLVNGSNTVKQQRTEPRYCTKWILAPGKKLEVEGFYVGGTGRNNVKPFTVLSDEESESLYEMNSGDMKNERLGTISMNVFVEGEYTLASDAPVTRSLSPLDYKEKAGEIKSIDDLKRLLKSAKSGDQNRTLQRGLIADDGRAQDGSRLVEEDFKNATEVQHLLIRYYDRKQK
jgi:hypothetical protein